ncbi:MAG: hypothetical protein RIQ79_255 [Verrucomicrobiota bacterium]
MLIQIRIAADGGIRLPVFIVRELESRLAARGLVLQAGDVFFDPSGRLSLSKVRLGLPKDTAPVIAADGISLDLRRLDLLGGAINPRRLEVTGLRLTLPARRSPSGADRPVLTAGDFLLTRPDDDKPWSLDAASARIFGVAASLHGRIVAPASPASPAGTGQAPADPLADLAANLESALGRLADVTKQIDAVPLASVAALDIDLSPDRLTVSTDIPRFEFNSLRGLPAVFAGASLEEARLVASVPLSQALEPDLSALTLRIAAARLAFPSLPAAVGPADAQGVDFTLLLDAKDLLTVNATATLSVHSINLPDTGLPSAPFVLKALWYPFGDRLDALLLTRLADSPWQVRALGGPVARSGLIAAKGDFTPALLEVVKPRLPPKTRDILSLTDPIQLDLGVRLDPGGKLHDARARFEVGSAVAHEVSFTRAGGQAVLEGDHLLVDELFLMQGENAATGSYEMDIHTLAYRFLLGGRLRPMHIKGWFTEWWDHLWANFDFKAAPPNATADIAGIWGQPELTTVFAAANTIGVRIRDLPLDSLAVRAWVQGHSTDIVGFQAAQGTARADGHVLRIYDPVADDWQRMEFDVRSNLPPEAIPQLFGDEGREITAPMRFSVPPSLHLAGKVFGPAAGTDAGHQRYTLDLIAGAPFHFHDFPLDRLAVRIERTNTELALHDIRAGFADGDLTGEAIVSGPSDARWLAFEAKLAKAPADTVLARWHEFQATRTPPPPTTAAAPAAAPAKPLGGRLDFTLTATGPLDDPLGFSGKGTAQIAGADLARIRLLGLFSELLNGLGLGFSTLKLSEADARFNLDRNTLAFERLFFTGSASPVEARGDYTMPDGNLAFTARVIPFEQGGLLGNTAGLVLSPFASALEVELGGTLDKPTWGFAHGPRKLLRKITNQFTPSPSEPKPAPAPPGTGGDESPRQSSPAP